MGLAAAEASDLRGADQRQPAVRDPLAIMNYALVESRAVDVPARGGAGPRRRHPPGALKEAREGDLVILAGQGPRDRTRC